MLVAQTFVPAILCNAENTHTETCTRSECRSGNAKKGDVLCDVNVEEVDVEPRLHESSYDSYGIYHVFGKVSATRIEHPSCVPQYTTHLYIQLGM